MELIVFLKKLYTEKQICKLFLVEMANKQTFQYWQDILRMMQKDNAFLDLERYFLKVKLTTKNLHDEIIRAFHISDFSYSENSFFKYEEGYLSAQGVFDDLLFKLPSSAEELSLWSKLLHNCMFSYDDSIRNGSSVVYGVFKEDLILYAIELNGKEMVQAKAVFNQNIPPIDMKKIRKWRDGHLV